MVVTATGAGKEGESRLTAATEKMLLGHQIARLTRLVAEATLRAERLRALQGVLPERLEGLAEEALFEFVRQIEIPKGLL